VRTGRGDLDSMIHGGNAEEGSERAKHDLLTYCGRDALATESLLGRTQNE
jgi:hypothetical protein